MNRTRTYRTARRTTTGLALIAGTAFLASAPCLAIETNEAGEREVTVSYGDLDLGHAEGAEALLMRIQNAAERACGVVSIREGVRRYNEAQRCVDQAVDKAVRLVRDERLQRLHASS